MKERRPMDAREAGERRPGMGDTELDERIAQDLGALRSVRAQDQDLPSLHETIRAAQKMRPDPGLLPHGIRRILMQALGFTRTRPLVAAAAVAMVLLVASMVIPVSYDRVTGHDVALTLSGGGLQMELVTGVAKDMKSRLGAAGVSVEAEAGNAGMSFVLRATAPERSRADVADVTSGLVRELASKGVSASVNVSPHKERVRYPVAAYAWDQIIQISVDGKSAVELENEIRQRLAEAGVPNAEVSVSDVPNGGRNVSLKVERLRTSDGSAPEPHEPMPQLVLTKDGAPIGAENAVKVQIQKRKTQDGAVTLIADVTAHGKAAKIEVPNVQSMSDSELASTLQARFREAGLHLNVTVTNGELKIEPVQ
ncbi:MAG TPA: hypothetical protein VFP58_06130 [Candidatus Eisenbacteria bacterium]|nr:hypothetical protein [Candidatus Eisenbacteria bacterium]